MRSRSMRSSTALLALLAVFLLVPAASLEAGLANPGDREDSAQIQREHAGFEAGLRIFLEMVWRALGGVVPLSGAGMDPNG